MTSPALNAEAMAAFAVDAKIGLIATVSPAGLPHVTLITTLMARDPTTLLWGQFCEGQSKRNVRHDPRTAFVVMDLSRRLWAGRARWDHALTEGPDYVRFNQKPMFRYNAYFGIHTVHVMSLVDVGPQEGVPWPRLIGGTLLAAAARPFLGNGADAEPVLNPWTVALLNAVDTLKFLAYVDRGGWPVLVPLVPCQAAGSNRLVFANTVHTAALQALDVGQPVAVFALNLKTESVLVRGPFEGFRGVSGIALGTLRPDFVYNTLPPQQGVIYPRPPLQAVTTF